MKSFFTPSNWPRVLVLTAALLSLVLLVTILKLAQSVFVPVALAILLTFLLSPIVRLLERLRMGRTPVVLVVVLLVGVLIASVGWLVVRQVQSLADNLPEYRENLVRKVAQLRQ